MATLIDLLASLPDDALIPVRWVREHAGAVQEPKGSGVDLTVDEVASKFGRGRSTVRTWLARGDLPGAYRLFGREWRVPVSAVEAMQAAQRRADVTRPKASHKRVPEIGEWRKHQKSG